MFIGLTSTASAKMEVGVQDDQTFVYNRLGGREAWLGKAQKLQASYIRVNVRWAYVVKNDPHQTVEPNKVQYNFSSFDDLVDSAAKRGIKVQMTLMGPAPAWATSNKRISASVNNPEAYGRFTRDVAEHFRGRVSRYAVWNEPNWHSQLLPAKKAPLMYGKMFRSASQNIWQVDSKNSVLFGELAPLARRGASTAPGLFVKGALKAGRIKADGFAQHPYDFKRGPMKKDASRNNFTMANTPYLKKFLKKNRKKLSTRSGKVLPIYFTEYGQFNKGSRTKKQKIRQKWLVDGFKQAKKFGAKQMLQYQLSKPDHKEIWDTSIVSQTGVESKSFKALYKYLKKAKKSLVKAKAFLPAPRRLS